MARKGWDNLSQTTRRRYERQGITRKDYEEGASLTAARGHGSSDIENAQRYINRHFQRYETFYADRPGAKVHGVREGDKERLLRGDVVGIRRRMEIQARMEKAYMSGHKREATRIYGDEFTQLDEADAPEWLGFYHGAFA